MQYWLLKTEPSCWSWADQIAHKTTTWDGVHNAQAQNYLKEMQVGDLAFFYHTGKEKQIMGTVMVEAPWFLNPNDLPYGAVKVTFKEPFKYPTPLSHIKGDNRLSHLPFLRQPRLSVAPIDEAAWDILCKKGNHKE